MRESDKTSEGICRVALGSNERGPARKGEGKKSAGAKLICLRKDRRERWLLCGSRAILRRPHDDGPRPTMLALPARQISKEDSSELVSKCAKAKEEIHSTKVLVLFLTTFVDPF